MDLKSLIKEAGLKSQEFADKYTYWACKRRKPMDLEWLMNELEEVLGRDYIMECALERLKIYKEKVEEETHGKAEEKAKEAEVLNGESEQSGS